MIFAEIHGKLYEDASRSEDVLTSTVFGLVRYLSFEDGLKRILHRVRQASQGRVISLDWTGLEDVRSFDVQFWPCLDECGVPDVLIELRDVQASLIGAGVVEVKYFSGKSGCSDDDVAIAPEESDGYDPDQLVKYWNGLRKRHPALSTNRLFVIYLTAHFRPPLKDLHQSQLRKQAGRFGWLSWYHVAEVADEIEALPARDLAQLLKFKGLGTFSGFRTAPLTLSDTRSFWCRDDQSGRWFTLNSLRELPHVGFGRS